MALRAAPLASDVAAVRRLVERAGVFSPIEIAVAGELVEERLRRGLAASGYHFVLAGPEHGRLLGYACFGPVPLTLSSWDLYWIAVDPDQQGQGFGGRLLEEVERRAKAEGAGAIYVDSSGRTDYAPARRFYAGHGYSLAAEFKDFFAPGDAKVVFRKLL